MNLKKELTIDGQAVELSHEAFGLKFYSRKVVPVHDHAELFFVVRDEKVIGRLEITADCGQNIGYVDEVKMVDFP